MHIVYLPSEHHAQNWQRETHGVQCSSTMHLAFDTGGPWSQWSNIRIAGREYEGSHTSTDSPTMDNSTDSDDQQVVTEQENVRYICTPGRSNVTDTFGPARDVISVHCNGNCIFHTMYFAAHGVALSPDSLVVEKRKVLKFWQEQGNSREEFLGTNEAFSIFQQIAVTPEATLMRLSVHQQNAHYAAQYVQQTHAGLATIATYAYILRKNVRLYIGGKLTCLHMKSGSTTHFHLYPAWEQEKQDCMTFYVHKNYQGAHMYWIRNENVSEEFNHCVFTDRYTRSEGVPWSQGQTTGTKWTYTHVHSQTWTFTSRHMLVAGEIWQTLQHWQIKGTDEDKSIYINSLCTPGESATSLHDLPSSQESHESIVAEAETYQQHFRKFSAG
jgi:hypothetical protein